MVQIDSTLLLAGLATVASARFCQNITIPLSISANNAQFSLKAPSSNIEVTNFVLNSVQAGVNYTNTLLKGYKTVSGTYNIAATYCTPYERYPGKALQVLTHGIGFDASYWDFPAKNFNYSYVEQALKRGYATLAYDRLGIGRSSHGEPVNEIQAFLEIAALKELTTRLRQGKVRGVSPYNKILHAGHSFGSIQTYALVANSPALSDGIALTGFSQTLYGTELLLAADFVLANTNPALKQYPNGYLISSTSSAVHTNYFAPNNFDPAILDYAVSTGKPVTVGELLTVGAPSAPNVINNFKGGVLVITGERDLPFCGGNCLQSGTSIPAAVQKSFPSTTIKSFVVPKSGHALNLEYTAPLTYKTILDFFDTKVIGAMPSGRP